MCLLIYRYILVSLIISYFSFQPVLHDWYNKDCGMCYPVSDAYKRTLVAYVAASGFLSRYRSGPLTYA